jgi:hypothetical protein
VGDVQKVRLVHRFQRHQHRTLEDFILICGYPQRASLGSRACLGNMDSTHRRCHVRAGFGAVEEVLEIGLQVDLVFVRGLSVHADGSVSACPSMGCAHPFDVDVMRQVREGQIRAVPGEIRDPLSFRGHGIRSRRTWHVSLQRFIRRRPLPSPGSLGWFPWLSGTTRRSDSLPPVSPHFVSFAWRYHRFVLCSSPPAQDLAGDQPGVGKPELLPAVTMEVARSPKFPGNPFDHSPCSSDPGVTRHADGSRCR